MINLLLKIEYKGTHYSGWQIQPNAVTIEGVIRKVMRQICQYPVNIKACGRTDAGVHAEGQVADVEVPKRTDLKKLFFSINSLLPADIAVTEMVKVPLGFSARKENSGKKYIYRIITSPVPTVFDHETYLWRRSSLDFKRLEPAMKDLQGEHDFSAFQGKGCQQPNPVKTLYSVDLKIRNEGNITKTEMIFKGSGFLKNMVRIMAGTLIEIGTGRCDTDTVKRALQSGKREDAGITAPPHGLVLAKVYFENDPFTLYPPVYSS